MNQIELRMESDMVRLPPQALAFNYAEIKQFLTESLQEYKTLVVTADGISDAKAKRAKINKLVDSINAYRINVKKQLMEQYDNDFKPKCDELVAMAKEAGDNIGSQIKAFEDAQADEKIEKIKSHYDFAPYAREKEYCSWDAIFNPKWGNKGYSIDQAKEEIISALLKTKEDLASIRTFDENDVPALLTEYKRTHDIGAVIRMSNTLKQQREAEAKRKAKIEKVADSLISHHKIAEAENLVNEVAEETVRTVIFKVVATDRQLQSLKGFLRANGIEYSRP